jgi:hypothetical protein
LSSTRRRGTRPAPDADARDPQRHQEARTMLRENKVAIVGGMFVNLQ